MGPHARNSMLEEGEKTGGRRKRWGPCNFSPVGFIYLFIILFSRFHLLHKTTGDSQPTFIRTHGKGKQGAFQSFHQILQLKNLSPSTTSSHAQHKGGLFEVQKPQLKPHQENSSHLSLLLQHTSHLTPLPKVSNPPSQQSTQEKKYRGNKETTSANHQRVPRALSFFLSLSLPNGPSTPKFMCNKQNTK